MHREPFVVAPPKFKPGEDEAPRLSAQSLQGHRVRLLQGFATANGGPDPV